MNIKLLGARVLVEIEKKEEKTASGLILSKTQEMREIMTGKIVKVGKGKFEAGIYIAPDMKEGDQIMFQYGTSVLYEGKSYLLVNESDVIMII